MFLPLSPLGIRFCTSDSALTFSAIFNESRKTPIGLELRAQAGSIMEVPLRGVKRRKTSGQVYFEMRYGVGKFYSTMIKSAEEGGLCYDIAQRYSELENGSSNVGGKRKAPPKLNYPDFSPFLQLDALPRDFDIQHNKEQAMEIILAQAQAAAKNLPKSLKHYTPVVGSQNTCNRSSSHQNVHGKSPRVAEVQQDLSGVCTSNEHQKLLQDISEFSRQCSLLFASKISERDELKRKVEDIKEDSGFICFPKPSPDKFHDHMAYFKQLISRDGKSPLLERCEQAYKSEKSKCWELRKILEDHNLKSIPESLMSEGNKMMGRRRENEKDRFPEVIEICSSEQSECSMPNEVSASHGPPSSPLVVVRPCETDVTKHFPAEMNLPQRVAPYELASGDKLTEKETETVGIFVVDPFIYTGCRRENEDGRPAEDAGMAVIQGDLDWTDFFFSLDTMPQPQFFHEHSVPFQNAGCAPWWA